MYAIYSYKYDFNQNKIFIFRLHLPLGPLLAIGSSSLSGRAFIFLVFIDFEALSTRCTEFILKSSAMSSGSSIKVQSTCS